MKNTKYNSWYCNATFITNFIIVITLINIIMSHSLAVKYNIGVGNIIRSILNHNFIYLVALVYFSMIKTNIGKKYFNFINLIYIFIYVFMVFTSFLSIFQSFDINSIINLLLNSIILLYMIYTFLNDTRYWKEFKLNKIPFDEIKNEWYFYAMCFLSTIILLSNLLTITDFNLAILSIFDSIYIILFGRYIYLYKNYEDNKNTKIIKRRNKTNE